MTNCGAWGWVTDRTGYRYAGLDPQSGQQGYGWGSAWVRTGKMAVARIPYFADCERPEILEPSFLEQNP